VHHDSLLDENNRMYLIIIRGADNAASV